MLNVQKLSLSIDGKNLFKDISLTITKDSKIGLVGFNGSGKSSFFKVLLGELTPDKGEVVRPKGFLIGSMPQFTPERINNQTIFEAVRGSAKLSHEDYEIDAILYKLGFEYETIHTKTPSALSGGWQKLVLLAIALIDDPDLLLLDEPTNHMDYKAKLIFENFLSSKLRIPYVIISHDRDLLDRYTEQTIFLRDKIMYNFAMPFSLSREELLRKDIAASEARKSEEKEISRLESSAKRLAFWGRVQRNESAASAAKSMEKRIGHLKENKTIISSEASSRIKIGTANIKANRVLGISNYDVIDRNNNLLFHIDELRISPEDRIVLLGTNGLGKSTLIHAIYENYLKFSKNKETIESFAFNPRITTGLFDQALSMIKPNEKIVKVLEQFFGHLHHPALIIKSAGLPEGYDNKEVNRLSGGEKARLQLVILEKSNYKFLLLDEPTSHLDISGVEDLENDLVDNNVTCLFTSHDKRFVSNVANRFLFIKDRKLTEISSPELFYKMIEKL